MDRFIGRYEHSLDPKGRVILPARIRTSFEALCYVSQQVDRCLALWTPDEFDRQAAAMEARQGLSPEDRNMARVWSAGSQELEIDKQGRVMLPQYLRDFAGLESQVLLMGSLNCVELWNPSEWSTRIAPAVVRFGGPTTAAPTTAGPPGGG